MQTKRIRNLQMIIIMLTIVTIISLTLAGVAGALYMGKVQEVSRLKAEREQQPAGAALPALSVDVESAPDDGTAADEVGSDAGRVADEVGSDARRAADEVGSDAGRAADGADSMDDADAMDISAMLQSKEAEVEMSIKDRMRELVTDEDGTPLKMLRSFFPENLIYSFEDRYVFAPVLENVKKHSLLDENFEKTEDGLMQYVEDGTVTSHKGIDVSKYQGKINWASVKDEGVEYAFIRIGLRGYESGKLVLDERYEENMKGANEAGIKAGVYFFTQAVTVEEAREEAAFVVEHMADYDVSCPVVLDVERVPDGDARADALTKEERTDVTIAFCEAIKEAGYTPMVYGNVVCFAQMLDMSRLNDYEKWYAFYDDYMYIPYDVSCWQYTEKGKVKGVPGNVDLNISFKEW